MSSNQYELPDPPADAVSAMKFAPGRSTKLLVSSWDKTVSLYEISEDGGGHLIKRYEHRAAVLDVCWGRNESEAFSVGLDTDVRRINLETSEQTVLGTHDSPAKSIVYSAEHDLLITGAWDATLHIYVLSKGDSQPLPNVVILPSKVFSLSLSPTKLVVAMASRQNYIYDLQLLAEHASQEVVVEDGKRTLNIDAWQRRESSLKFMTRAVACMNDDEGYVTSSIEGRVAVEWFDPSPESQARKYAFKSHRQMVDGVDMVYPIHALAFHPKFSTFATGGGDAVVSLWDGVAKRRIRQYQKYPASIASLAFSSDGKFLAIGVSPGLENGEEEEMDGKIKVFIRELGETEAKGKDKN